MSDELTAPGRAKALSIIPHITGSLSILGSISIIWDIIREKKKWKSYHRILFSMSLCDIVSSFAYAMSTWPIPQGVNDGWGDPYHFQAYGNEKTCTAQGIGIQFSVVTAFYSVALSVQYLLVVRYNVASTVMAAKYDKFMLLIPPILALLLTVPGIPLKMYANSNLWCWIATNWDECPDDPDQCVRQTNVYRFIFYYGPLWGAIFIVVCAQALLWRTVRQIEKKIAKYDFARRNSDESARGRSPRTSILLSSWYVPFSSRNLNSSNGEHEAKNNDASSDEEKQSPRINRRSTTITLDSDSEDRVEEQNLGRCSTADDLELAGGGDIETRKCSSASIVPNNFDKESVGAGIQEENNHIDETNTKAMQEENNQVMSEDSAVQESSADQSFTAEDIDPGGQKVHDDMKLKLKRLSMQFIENQKKATEIEAQRLEALALENKKTTISLNRPISNKTRQEIKRNLCKLSVRYKDLPAQRERKKRYARSRQIAIQSLLYVGAFIITWLPYTITSLMMDIWFKPSNNGFWMLLTIVICQPLQGFLNAIIYHLPKMRRYAKRFKCYTRNSLQSHSHNQRSEQSKNSFSHTASATCQAKTSTDNDLHISSP